MGERRDLSLLFSPGAGIAPPLLAGREEELQTMDKRFRLARAGKGRSVVLIGPRGNGKTVLLEEFARRCRKAGADVVRRTPSKLRTEEDLAIWLLDADPKRRGAQRETTEGKDAIWPAPLDALAEFAEKAWGKSAKYRKSTIPGLLASNLKGMNETLRATALRHTDLLLEYAARWRPRMAIIDEAHTLAPEIAQSLLNTAQNVNSAGGAFLLVLAGTPQLPNTLRAADASFWSRCEKIGVGRLSDEATREALAKPLAQYGVSFAPEALDAVVEESQRYPFFIQLLGEALVLALPEADARGTGAQTIDLSMVEAARASFKKEKNSYYEDRFEELKERRLLPVASAVAAAFEERGGQPMLDETIEAEMTRRGAVGQGEAAEATGKLERLGFIWKPFGGTRHEPGIPSLMTHVLERGKAPAPAAGKKPESAPAP